MKKFAPRLGSLAVESFSTAAKGPGRGTVRGHGDDCT